MKQRYFISRHQSTELSEVIEFVIDQNNKHHKKNQEKDSLEVGLVIKQNFLFRLQMDQNNRWENTNPHLYVSCL